MNSGEEKIISRKKIQNKTKNLLYNNKISGEIQNHLIQLKEYKRAQILLCYAAMNDEISTDKIMEQAFKDGKKVALPRIADKKKMEFFYICDKNIPQQLEKGSYEIKEPKTSLEKLDRREIDNTVIVIVPGRAFTTEGIRLGRGKGYYDRYFKQFLTVHTKCPVFVGLCSDEQILTHIPKEEHDLYMDYIITETNVYRRNI